MKKLLAILLALCLLLLCGCGKQEAPEKTKEPTTQSTEPTTAPTTDNTPEDPTLPQDGKTVSSVLELLEAIKPGAKIELEPGVYHLSQALDSFMADKGSSWNAAHPYVQLRESFDGVEVVIQNVKNLSIQGTGVSRAETEIITDPRYSAVLAMENCSEVTLSGITMGHTGSSECSGDVIDMRNCQYMTLFDMDLYGCGVFAIDASEGSAYIFVDDSYLRDCSSGPICISNCSGIVQFRRCRFTGSEGGGWFDDSDETDVCFYDCMFGEQETNYWYFNENVTAEDCFWSEITEYPDIEPPDLDDKLANFDPDVAELIATTQEDLETTQWYGHLYADQVNDTTTVMPFIDSDGAYMQVCLNLVADGIGYLDYKDQRLSFDWEMQSEYNAVLHLTDGRNFFVSRWTAEDGSVWLQLQMEEIWIWCY